jgi:ZIP family zinc transporter
METIERFFSGIGPVYAALLATLFTWLVTAAGASLVFFFKTMNRSVLDVMLGFTGGVMVAASFWSLLNPAIEMSERLYPGWSWMPAAVGFLLGASFIFVLDRYMPHLHINFGESEGLKTQWHRTTLLILAITLHNIPEGLAVGVLFGAAASGMPLRRNGVSRRKCFWYGQLSAIVEPVAGVLGALAVMVMQPILPFALAFAAGAMIYVVVEEVIPETQKDKFTDIAVMGFMGGFLIMMILDVALG